MLTWRKVPTSRSLELPGSPAGMFGNHGVLIFATVRKQWDEFALAAVAHGNDRISPQPGQRRPTDGRTAKSFPKPGGIHPGEPFQGGVDQSRARLELR